MIVACPQCEAKYRVDPERVGPEGARLRCARCESVFRVEPPSADVERAATPQPSSRPVSAPQSPVSDTSSPDRDRMVLIADSDAESAKATASALSSWGLEPVMVLDGVEAMLSIQRLLPRVVVLDVGLTKMYGFQVCEIVKRNESLRHIKCVLVGSVHHAERYRRPPVELYGADVYLEKPDIPDALLPCLRQFGFPVPGDDGGSAGPAPSMPGPMPSPAPEPSLAERTMPDSPALQDMTLPSVESMPEPALEPEPSFDFEESSPALELTEPAPPEDPAFEMTEEPVFGSAEAPEFGSDVPQFGEEEELQFGSSDDSDFASSQELSFDLPDEPEASEPAPEAAPPVDPELEEQRATAERLARIIVSDIVLYNPDKFEAAVAAGNVVEALESDLAEGRKLFQQRVDARVREEKDHLREELLRVAREKGMA